jgi:hypothetical protein
MEDLRNMLAIMASGYRYNELTADGQEYVQSKANYLYNKFDGRISDVHHVITYAKFKGWL